jgi:hypothetical protein
MTRKHIWLSAFFTLVVMSLMAHTPDLGRKKPQRPTVVPRGFCANSESFIDQDINNVRARLLGGGDCWWDFTDGRYIVPKVDPTSGQREVSSIFAASVWLGGVDAAGNLKLACQDYRPGGRNDFWPGPLDPVTGTTTEEVCKSWDRHFKVTGDEIRQHLNNVVSGLLDPALIPRGVKGWPAKGNPYFIEVNRFPLPSTQQGLAGFFDADFDGEYDPLKGDYPSIEIRGCDASRYPSEMVFWIYNDEGSNSSHGRTGGDPIQMEVQVQAFGYQTSDALNDMTFQRYKLINRATELIDSTYFAMWVDADLGCFQDDYIGCDTINDLMVTYNQDAVDGQPGANCGDVATYGDNVPMIGVDYFRGPRRPITIIDSITGEPIDILVEIGMSSFMYFNNPNVGTPEPPTTDPNLPAEFYNYLTGTWRDGTPLTFGGTGYNVGSTNLVKYALPSNPNDPNGWSMCTANLNFGDRRTLQASGPFLLKPGAQNELIIGVPFVANIDYPCPDVELLLRADKLAQGLFDNCFERLEGPDAPTVGWVEMDRQLIAVLSNSGVSNNKDEGYIQKDFLAPNTVDRDSASYKFEGYKIFQVLNPQVSVGDFDDPDQARLVAQVDKKNGIKRIFNWVDAPDPTDPENIKKKVFYPVERVDGGDAGIRNTFSITEDQFATGNARQLINHKKYYYAVVAYAHNNYRNFEVIDGKEFGQQNPYLEGGRVMIQTVIPRPILDRVLNSAYGDGVAITRLEGVGAGGNFLDMSDEERTRLINSGDGNITYLPGKGPLNIIIFNPFEVKEGEFEVQFVDSNGGDNILDKNATWELKRIDIPNSPVVASARGIDEFNEQVFAEYGFSVTITQRPEPGNYTPSRQIAGIEDPGPANGGIGQEWAFANPNQPWLFGLQDGDNGNLFNFVRRDKNDDDFVLDPEGGLSSMGNGVFVPYPVISAELPFGPFATGPGAINRMITPAWTGKIGGNYYNSTALGDLNPMSSNNRYTRINALPNVDIVFTNDKSLWSRCVVIETASEYYTGNVAGVIKDPTLNTESGTGRIRQSFDSRYALSVGKDDNNGDGLPDEDNAIEPDSLPDPTATLPNKKVVNPVKGQPLRGMGWFPGYAINVETGERLNVFFGENSVYSKTVDPAYTGRDMLFNPTSQFLREENFAAEVQDFLMGGQHFVYVSNTKYDECLYIRARLNPDYWTSAALKNLRKVQAIENIAWAGMLGLTPSFSLKSLKDGLIPDQLVVKLRVENGYAVQKNGGSGHPRYRFKINGQSATELDVVQVENAMDSIKMVPNPYYGFSEYESSAQSNVVKITNLPAKCVVSIYSLDGRFIRQYKRDESYSIYSQITPALEWDLKNNKGVPVAAGVYLIHVQADGMGERTLKWFGVPRFFTPVGS